tara:strand:- start:109 stop:678 length:570 start_codon:yes stop_codon:yes gene_type:complete
MTIIKRGTKGTALTYSELDGNFTDLDTRVLELEKINSVMETWYYDTQDRAHADGDHLYRSWTKFETLGTAHLGTGLTNETGLSTFKFTSTGYWLITINFCFFTAGATNSSGILLMYSSNGGSSFTNVQLNRTNTRANGAHGNLVLPHTFKITDIANQQFLYKVNGNDISVRGGSGNDSTKLHVLKLRGL